MKRKEIRELLSRHVDALVQGEDLTSDLVEDFGNQDDQIESLLALASTLKTVLVPVPNPTPMQRSWMNQFDPGSAVLIRQARRFPEMWYLFAIIGSLFSLISVAIIVIRRLKYSGRKQQKRLTSTA